MDLQTHNYHLTLEFPSTHWTVLAAPFFFFFFNRRQLFCTVALKAKTEQHYKNKTAFIKMCFRKDVK